MIKYIYIKRKGFQTLDDFSLINFDRDYELKQEIQKLVYKTAKAEILMTKEEKREFNEIIKEFNLLTDNVRKEKEFVKRDCYETLEDFKNSIKKGKFFSKMNKKIAEILKEVENKKEAKNSTRKNLYRKTARKPLPQGTK